MSQCTNIRACIFCGHLIRFNPTAGELGLLCPNCLRSLLTDDDNYRPPKPARPRWNHFDSLENH